jgi:hypothetical protein
LFFFGSSGNFGPFVWSFVWSLFFGVQKMVPVLVFFWGSFFGALNMVFFFEPLNFAIGLFWGP